MQSLQFRIANRRRRNEIIELEAQVLYTVIRTQRSKGRSVRRYRLLPLERNKVTFFPLSWRIVHPIDEEQSAGSARFAARISSVIYAEILVLLTGVDETLRADRPRAHVLSPRRDRMERTVPCSVFRGHSPCRVCFR